MPSYSLPMNFLGPGAEGLGEGVVGVAEEDEGEFVFGDELFVAFDAIGADAEHFYPCRFDTGDVITEIAGFGGATGGVVFGVEIEDIRGTGQTIVAVG